ncbi:esterase-like activity of phytase family protein [Sphingobium sp. H39-3-25]|uniref:esterase-like activity of phytase family protein n=1 Tax=Sphingobium arseniciresistens TaxID=3030834 RepID=UPI0023BA3B67|nr:esterase-like activity of phytase family protein [Sphingobium arseniciresistens]
MPRIPLILLLAALLLPPPHEMKSAPVTPGALLVSARAVPLDSGDPAVRQAGALPFLGGWVLHSQDPHFGGISSMLMQPDGSILGLSDSGTLMGFSLSPGNRRQFIAPLPTRPSERDWPSWKWDSESMVHDPQSGRYWVGFELIQRICRYAPGFARVEACRGWPEIQAWPETGSIEAMVRLKDGRFLAFSEMGFGPHGGNDVLLFAGDPTEKATPHPRHLAYHPPQGYHPTDAVQLPDGSLIVLNRRVTLHEGFTAVLVRITLPPFKEGAQLASKPLARLAPPLLADNFEGLALSQEKGRTVLWVISDDNHQFFERTLLLKFALPDRWD